MGGLWPVDTGGRRRSFQTLNELSRRHDVVVLTTHGPHEDGEALRQHLPACREVRSLPFAAPKYGSAQFAAALARSWASRYPVDVWKWRHQSVRDEAAALATSGFDVVVADFIFAAVNAPWHSGVPIVYFAHNVEHLIWKRLCDGEQRRWRRLLLELEWRKLRRYESVTSARARLTIAVSPADRERLIANSPRAQVVATPTGVDTEFFAPASTPVRPRHVVFSGSMDWYPNEDAVLHFVGDVLPGIRAVLPDVTLTIVGRNPGPRVRALGAMPGVHVTGTVEDVRPFIAEAAACVVPLRIGGGTRLKIFEALAMGKAVLSTTIGAEGLSLVPNTHIALADGAERLASTLVSLLQDPARCRAMGQAGRHLTTSRYGWHCVVDDFEARLHEAAREHRAGQSTAARRLAVP